MTKPRRVKFVSLILDTLPEDKVQVEVELEWRGESYYGRTKEVLLQEDIEFTCAARAACVALNTLMEDRQTTFEYLKCEPITAVGQELAVVAVAIHVDGDNQYTVGVSRVRDDPPHAAVRAVLNAASIARCSDTGSGDHQHPNATAIVVLLGPDALGHCPGPAVESNVEAVDARRDSYRHFPGRSLAARQGNWLPIGEITAQFDRLHSGCLHPESAVARCRQLDGDSSLPRS
jgi:hypothetical protein